MQIEKFINNNYLMVNMRWEPYLTEEDREAVRERLYRPFRALGNYFRKISRSLFHCGDYPEESSDVELEVRGSKLRIRYRDSIKRR